MERAFVGKFGKYEIRPALRHLAFHLSTALICLQVHPGLAADPAGTTPRREALIIVKGVATPFSVFGLIHRFKQIPGVEDVVFYLSRGLADVTLKPGATVSDEEFRQAIRNASYTPGAIRWKQAAAEAHAN